MSNEQLGHARRRRLADERKLLAQLTPAFRARIYAAALRAVGHPALAEDVTQDVLVRFWRKPELLGEDKEGVRKLVLTGKIRDALRARGDVFGTGGDDNLSEEEF